MRVIISIIWSLIIEIFIIFNLVLCGTTKDDFLLGTVFWALMVIIFPIISPLSYIFIFTKKRQTINSCYITVPTVCIALLIFLSDINIFNFIIQLSIIILMIGFHLKLYPYCEKKEYNKIKLVLIFFIPILLFLGYFFQIILTTNF